jgi:ribonuclease HI
MHPLPIFRLPFGALSFRPIIIESIGLDKRTSLDPISVNKEFSRTLLERWPDCIEFYTDGSKLDDGSCGAGLYCPLLDIQEKIKLPSFCSVFTAECTAFKQAISTILLRELQECVVFTDSLSLVQKLQSPLRNSSNDEILCTIFDLLFFAHKNKIKITTAWIPSHIGIPGNEKADVLAKDAAINGKPPHDLIFPPSDYLSVIMKNIHEEWSDSWKESTKGAQYKMVKQNITVKPWFHKTKFSKPSISTLCRLRIGHCCIGAHLHKIGVASSPLCECGEEAETLNHIFFNCNKFNNLQFIMNLKKINISFPTSIQALLALRRDDVDSIILKAISDNNRKF